MREFKSKRLVVAVNVKRVLSFWRRKAAKDQRIRPRKEGRVDREMM